MSNEKIAERVIALWSIGVVLISLAVGMFTESVGVTLLLVGAYCIGLGFMFMAFNGKG